jgi:hypothetical protein
MANVFNLKRTDGRVRCPVLTATVIEVGDLLYHDGTSVYPASSQVDNVGEEDNQAEFARTFIGVALEASASGQTADILVETNPNAEFEFTVPSATYAMGALLGASEAGSGTALEDQVLEAVTSQDLAIFTVSKDEAAATTTVRCKMIRSLAWGNDKVSPRYGVTTATLTGALVLTHDSNQYQFLDPGGAGRNVDLPAEEESAGLFFMIANTADAAEVLTIRNDAAGTICTPTQAETALVFCNGVTWVGLVGASS